MFNEKTLGLFFMTLIMLILVIGCSDILIGGPANFSGGGGSVETSGMSWGPVEMIDLVTGTSIQKLGPHQYFKKSMDKDGNIIIVWIENEDNGKQSLYAKNYLIGSGWLTTQQLDNDSYLYKNSQNIAIDANGNAIVVWRQSDDNGNHVWSNRYIKGYGWSGAVQVEDGSTNAENPSISINDNGVAFAVWRKFNGNIYDIKCAKYIPGAGWGEDHIIDNASDNTYTPEVNIDNNGNAIFIWRQGNDNYDLYSCIYNSITDYNTPVKLADDIIEFDMESNTIGRSLIVWRDSASNIKSKTYISGEGFYSTQDVENIEGNSYMPDFSMNNNGDTFFLWNQVDTDGKYKLYFNKYLNDVGILNEEIIENNDDVGYNFPEICFDSNSNSIAVWYKLDGPNYNIYSKIFKNDKWGETTKLNTGLWPPQAHEICMDNNGNAIVLWLQYDGEKYHINYRWYK